MFNAKIKLDQQNSTFKKNNLSKKFSEKKS